MEAKRTKEIKALKRKGLTYKEIGVKYGLTGERIRQIVWNVYSKKDSKHVAKQYKDFYKNKGVKSLVKEIELLVPQNRKSEFILRRVAMIKILKDKYGLSFNAIGDIMHRDHTTVIYLYRKNKICVQ